MGNGGRGGPAYAEATAWQAEVGSQMSATSRKQFGMLWRPIRTCYEQRAIFQVTPPNVPRGAARHAISHHPWLIGKNEQEEHGEVTRPDQELAEEKKEKEPVKLSRSPDPVRNDTKHRDRLEDHGNKIQAVGIVELVEPIMMRQPAAAVKKAIHPDGADQGNRGINDRLGFQKLEVSEASDLAAGQLFHPPSSAPFRSCQVRRRMQSG